MVKEHNRDRQGKADPEATAEFIDGISYDGRKPNAYIDALPIGLKGQQKVDGSEVVGG